MVMINKKIEFNILFFEIIVRLRKYEGMLDLFKCKFINFLYLKIKILK